MPTSTIANVILTGIAACVPRWEVSNLDCELLSPEERRKLVQTTGIERRRVAAADQCSSDFCCAAAESLLAASGTARNEIEALVFVTQNTDFPLPATSAILQHRLGLPKSCLAIDIVLGCSGYVYGLGVASSMLSAMRLRKGLLLVGDTVSKVVSTRDRSTAPLFGDAGTATLLEYSASAPSLDFDFGTDGTGHEAIMIRQGGLGSRFPAGKESFEDAQVDEGISRNGCQLILDGIDVFNFSLREPVQSVRRALEHSGRNIDAFDAFFFHQANLMMNELIRKSLKILESKHPYSLREFGNTSCATIPLTIVSKYRTEIEGRPNLLLLSGFGVGLSWGTCVLQTQDVICPELIEL